MNVDDARMLVVKLDNIIFGSNKIHVNLPRFHRDEQGQKMVQSTYGQQRRYVIQPKNQLKWTRVDKGVEGAKKIKTANGVWDKIDSQTQMNQRLFTTGKTISRSSGSMSRKMTWRSSRKCT